MSKVWYVALLFILGTAEVRTTAPGGAVSLMKTKAMKVKLTGHSLASPDLEARASANKMKGLKKNKEIPCVDGFIEGSTIPCKDINLVAFLSGEELGSPYASKPNPIFFATYVSTIVTTFDPTCFVST